MASVASFDIPDLKEQSADDAVHSAIELAVEVNASDLFLLTETRAISVAIRRNGQLQRISAVPMELGQGMIACIKALAALDISERRRPMDGRWLFDDRVDIRINTMPTLHGEDVCLRLGARKDVQFELDNIGLFPDDDRRLKQLLRSPSGLILVTGPTGSGKSTTLYSCLQFLNDGTRKINTLEDPVEYALAGIRQTQINPKIGIDFSDLLPSVLRQSPDVIMIGEIRDSATAQIAVRAANSGHLVLATLHARVSTSAVKNMLFFDVSPHFLSDCLLAVISQRLFRKLCDQCRQQFGEEYNQLGDLDLENVEQMQQFISNQESMQDEPTSFFGPVGCSECFGEGYQDREALFEMMTVNAEIRSEITGTADGDVIREAAINNGMFDFQRGARIKIAQGKTSPEEILRVISADFLGL